MEKLVNALAATSDTGFGQAPSQPQPKSVPTSLQSKIAAGSVDEADLRLVIEEAAGSYIYKTVNRVTGEVLTQYPNEHMIKMREDTAYEAGKVIRAKA